MNFPGFKGRFIVDTFRGQMRVRKWPRKRGTPKSQAVRDQNQWFTEANKLAKRVEPSQQALAIAMTLGTGMYPRDLLIAQQAGGIWEIIEADGTVPQYRRYFRETVVFQGIICDKTSTQVIPASSFTPIIWTLPIIDTAGFWNAGDPTRITIPAGINVIELNGAWRATGGSSRSEHNLTFRKNGAFYLGTVQEVVAVAGATISSGPIAVVEGDIWTLELFINVGRTCNIAPFTGFTLNVLDAD